MPLPSPTRHQQARPAGQLRERLLLKAADRLLNDAETLWPPGASPEDDLCRLAAQFLAGQHGGAAGPYSCSMATLASHLQPLLRAIQPPIKLRAVLERSKPNGCMAVLHEPSFPSDLTIRLNPDKLLTAATSSRRCNASGPSAHQLPSPGMMPQPAVTASAPGLGASALLASREAAAYASSPTGGGRHEAFDISLPSAKVCGISTLSVRLMSLSGLAQDDISWLLGAAAPTSASPSERDAPQFVGFDTVQVVDRLALIQLGSAERVLLIRVLPSAAAGAANRGRQLQHLETLLDCQSVLKAGSEVWQALLMVHHSLGLHVQGGACLTALNKGNPRLFMVLETLYPRSGIKKDTAAAYSGWMKGELSPQQIRYGALNAFASWAVAMAAIDLTQVMNIATGTN